jgi:hypothetical protein
MTSRARRIGADRPEGGAMPLAEILLNAAVWLVFALLR